MKRVVSTMFCAVLVWAASCSAAAIDDAKALFEQYVQLEHAFDPAAAVSPAI